MRTVSAEEIDDLVKWFEDGGDISADESHRRFSEVQLLPPANLPVDPFSSEYRQRYLDLYRKVSGRSEVSTRNERVGFDVKAHTFKPFPYFTQSTRLASQHYLLIGHLLSMLDDLKPGSAVLDMGCGWGNTTIALALLGHRVVGLDIEHEFCEAVRERAGALRAESLSVVCDDFLWVERTDQKFDAVIFFESFHHCWEFPRLLLALHRVLNPGGKIYFGAEPIDVDFAVPWGVRLDGESLYVARKRGWMELGFRNDYFVELLSQTGWLGRCVQPHFWIAHSMAEPIVVEAERLNSQPVSAAPYYASFGPYLSLPKGRYRGEYTITNVKADSLTIDACCNQGTVIGVRVVPAEEIMSGFISLEFDLPRAASDVEVRLLVPPDFSGRIKQLSVTPLEK